MARTSPSRSVGTIANPAAPSPLSAPATQRPSTVPTTVSLREARRRAPRRAPGAISLLRSRTPAADSPVPGTSSGAYATHHQRPGLSDSTGLRTCGRSPTSRASRRTVDRSARQRGESAAGPVVGRGAGLISSIGHSTIRPVIWWISTLWRISRNTKNVFNACARDSRVPFAVWRTQPWAMTSCRMSFISATFVPGLGARCTVALFATGVGRGSTQITCGGFGPARRSRMRVHSTVWVSAILCPYRAMTSAWSTSV